jgi:hypothetical protein
MHLCNETREEIGREIIDRENARGEVAQVFLNSTQQTARGFRRWERMLDDTMELMRLNDKSLAHLQCISWSNQEIRGNKRRGSEEDQRFEPSICIIVPCDLNAWRNRHTREKASLLSEINVLFPISFQRKIMLSQGITRYDPGISIRTTAAIELVISRGMIASLTAPWPLTVRTCDSDLGSDFSMMHFPGNRFGRMITQIGER